MDDLPPPPYSLRDPHESDRLIPATSPDISAFNSFIPSPTLDHTPAFTRNDGQSSSIPRQYVAHPTLTLASPLDHSRSNSELEQAGFVSAAPYFELRVPNRPRPNDMIYHHMTIRPCTGPSDYPLPQPHNTWHQRGVDYQDWLTFLNHLFHERSIEARPGHTQQELDMERLRLGELENQKSRPEGLRSSNTSRPGPSIRRPMPTDHHDSEKTRLRLDAVAKEWNTGFFEPRGLNVVIDFPEGSPP